MTYISQYYYNWKQAETAKKQVLEISGLDINLTGSKLRDYLVQTGRCLLQVNSVNVPGIKSIIHRNYWWILHERNYR